MTDDIIEVLDLGKKINLLLSNGFHQITTATKLAEKSFCADFKKSGLNTSEISRFKTRGDSRININKFKGLCNAYPQIPEQLWHQPLEVFAQELGLSSFQKPSLAMLPTNKLEIPIMGIDFKSRIKDKEFLERRFEIMKGYWEVFSYSISIREKSCVSYNILEIKELNMNGYIECLMPYGDFNYYGYCFFVSNTTYFILEEINLLNEIIFFATNSPERNINPILNGVKIALTGGSSELIAIPSATKISLQHIDSLNFIKEKYKLNNDGYSIKEIIKKIRLILNSDATQLNDILPFIDNHVPQDAVPYTLRAKLF